MLDACYMKMNVPVVYYMPGHCSASLYLITWTHSFYHGSQLCPVCCHLLFKDYVLLSNFLLVFLFKACVPGY